MNYKYYERKINDIINKCPIESGVEILIYNVLDSVIDNENYSLVDINRLWKDRDTRLTTNAGIPDIAILSNDFQYRTDNGQVYAFIEVKATNITLSITEQIENQKGNINHYIYTNGLVWKYFENKQCSPKWEILLTPSEIKSISTPSSITIDEDKFMKLLNSLKLIDWKG